jgi:putative membrane protein
MFNGFFGEFFLLGLLNAVFWIGVIVAVILGVRWLIRQNQADRSSRPPEDPALEVLRQRYARGEIDAATFEQMRERLEGTGTRDTTPLSI